MTETTAPQSDDATPPSLGRRAWVWGERLLTLGLLVFVVYRLGPQVGALTGIRVGVGVGDTPAYTIVTLDGDTLRASDLRGQVVVVNFWATWCTPCKLEMPSLQKLSERRAGDGVVVIGLSTDVAGDAVVRDFLSDRGITFPIGRATPEQRRAFGGIPGTPTTFLIGRDGTLHHRVVGYFAPPALNAAVARMLGEPPPS